MSAALSISYQSLVISFMPLLRRSSTPSQTSSPRHPPPRDLDTVCVCLLLFPLSPALSCLVSCLVSCFVLCLVLSCLVLSCLLPNLLSAAFVFCQLPCFSCVAWCFVRCLVFCQLAMSFVFYLFFCLLPCLLRPKDTAVDKRIDRRQMTRQEDEKREKLDF